jgi:hypothetical protein
LNNEILTSKQKEELNKLILAIKKMDIENVIKEDKKLDIVFDLDSTCIFAPNIKIENYKKLIEKCKVLRKHYTNNNLKIIQFNYNNKYIYNCLIIRNGLSDFLSFAKQFCKIMEKKLRKY